MCLTFHSAADLSFKWWVKIRASAKLRQTTRLLRLASARGRSFSGVRDERRWPRPLLIRCYFSGVFDGRRADFRRSSSRLELMLMGRPGLLLLLR